MRRLRQADLCLLERLTDLGLMLAVIAVVRTYARTVGAPAERQEAVDGLGVVALVYQSVASSMLPASISRVPSSTIQDHTTRADSGPTGDPRLESRERLCDRRAAAWMLRPALLKIAG